MISRRHLSNARSRTERTHAHSTLAISRRKPPFACLRRSFFAFGALAIIGVACSDDDNTTQPPDVPTGDVLLHFVHVVDGETLALNEMKYVNAAGDTFEVQTLRYYLSDFGLDGADEDYNAGNVHLIDIKRPETHELSLTGIPAGQYSSLVFTFGLDADKNRSNFLPNTEENREMEWPVTWGGGYHYMQLEGRFRNQSPIQAFLTHAGRFADDARPAEHHFFDVSLSDNVSIVADETTHIEVVVNIAEWYRTPNTISLTEHDAMMDDFDKQVALEQNGKQGALFAISSVTAGRGH